MSNNKRLILLLSKDVLFKPEFLSIIISQLGAENIAGVVEVAKITTTNRLKPNVVKKIRKLISEWSFLGILYLLLAIIFAKLKHLLSQRLGFSSHATIKSTCKNFSIDYLFSNNVNNDQTAKFCLERQPSIIISFQHQLIFKDLINIANGKLYNCHPSDLPKYRGIKPIHWAMLNNENHFSVSIHQVEEQYDCGAVFRKRRIFLNQNISIFRYYQIAHQAAAYLVSDFVAE